MTPGRLPPRARGVPGRNRPGSGRRESPRIFRRCASAWGLVALLTTGGAVLRDASAAEGEAQLALTGAAGLGAADSSPALGGSLDFWLGLDDFLWLELTTGAGTVLGPRPRAGAEAGPGVEALAGLVAALDVLAWVPWAEGALGVVASDTPELYPAARLGLGLDRLFGPTWALGGLARVHLGPRSVGGTRIVGGLRLSLRFEL